MSLQNILTRGILKSSELLDQGLMKIRWLPVYFQFQSRGHGSAWNVFTHMTTEERLLLYWLGMKQPPGAILVEVGSYLGASACFLAAAVSTIGHGARLHCVDTWQNETMSEGLRDTWREFQRNTRSYEPFIVSHRGQSVEVAKTFNEPIDFLFLDGDHSYEGCRTDAEAWVPLMKPGAILVMHDYRWEKDVRRVVHEMIHPRESETGRVFQNTYWTRL